MKGVERQRTYDDMLAVAQDLIARRLTSAKRIGLFGHSAGGLLAGVMITQQPDLFGAAVLLAPMLDNFRMDLLLGGEGMLGSEMALLAIRARAIFLRAPRHFRICASTTAFQFRSS